MWGGREGGREGGNGQAFYQGDNAYDSAEGKEGERFG